VRLLRGTDWMFIYNSTFHFTQRIYVLCGSENKQRLFPYTALTNWFYNRDLTLLKPSGHYMYSTVVTICTASLTFTNSTFCPTQCIYVFCVDLRTNSDYFSIQHQVTGLYNRDGECLLRGTDWIFICNSIYYSSWKL